MNIITDITSGLVVIAGAVVAEAATDPVTHYAGLFEKFGVMACLLLYFLVRDYYRNKADMAEKMANSAKHDALEDFIRIEFMKQLTDSTGAIRSNEKTHKRLLEALEHKTPCLAEAAEKAKQAAKKDTDKQ
jgi:threonine aldolase